MKSLASKQYNLNGTVIEEVIPAGKIKCVITGKIRNETPEEKVRQEVARSLLEEYGYDRNDIGLPFPIVMGRAKKEADIVIFYEGRNHIQENIYIIIETKTEEVKASDKDNGIPQLKSYLSASLSAKFGLWVGSERVAYQIGEEQGKRKFIDIPDIPPRGETIAPRPTRGHLVPAVNLKPVFKRIHNYIYVNQGLQKDKAFEELLKLIFIKVFDEQYSPTLQFYVLPKEDMSLLRKRLLNVLESVRKRYSYIFGSSKDIIGLDDRVLVYTVSELQRFSLVKTETDVKGEAYEEIVGPNLRGDRGEFFTPRNVCRMTIDFLFSFVSERKITSPGTIKILDPAVGTGGFLIAGIHQIKEHLIDREHDRLRDLIREIAETNLYGIDFNPFLVKVAQMNLVMHGDGSANMLHANSLERPYLWADFALQKVFSNEIEDYGGMAQFRRHLAALENPNSINETLARFDIVITNPPFGTKAVIDDTNILSQYEIATFGSSSLRKAMPPEQLFIERCVQFVKPGGVIGIVLPDSIVSNPGLAWLRKWILTKCYIIASIDLPTETFEPNTGTQTSVLILKKKSSDQMNTRQDYEIFAAIPHKVGHDRRGNPIYKLTTNGDLELDGKGQPMIDDDIPSVSDIFRKWAKGRGII